MESIATPPVTGISLIDCTVIDTEIGPGTGAVGLQRTQDVSLGTVSITTAKSAVAFSADNSAQFTIDQLNVTVTGPPLGSEAGGPFAVFQGSSGTVAAADLVWEQAPSSWLPVLIFSDSCVGGTPTNPEVSVGTVTTIPPKERAGLRRLPMTNSMPIGFLSDVCFDRAGLACEQLCR